MGTYENAAASSNGEREYSINRLTEIDGIARKTAEAMYEIGLHSYADLAQYLSQHTAQQVSVALKEHGVNRPPAFIDQANWARQAREFDELVNAAPAPPKEDTEPAEKPEEALPSPDLRAHDAVFTVSFDVSTDGDREHILHTTVCDGTNGGQERVFQGKDTAPWVNWILERAHLPVPVEPGDVRLQIRDVRLQIRDVRLEIRDVRLSVIRPTAARPEKKLKAEVSFQLSGSDAETLASKGIPFRIEGYTLDIESGVSELVASGQSQLVPQVFEYVGEQEFGIPDVGLYKFHSIVLLLPPGKTATYHCGPTIRVVP